MICYYQKKDSQNKYSCLSEPLRIIKILFFKLLYGYFRNKKFISNILRQAV